MQLLEQDKPAFKQWLLPKLQNRYVSQEFLCFKRHTNGNRSEAEPEVLADYVAELFGGGGTKDEIKRNSVYQLSDFLADCT